MDSLALQKLSGHGGTGCNFNTQEVETKVIFDYMVNLKSSLYTRPYKRKEKGKSGPGSAELYRSRTEPVT